MAAIPSAPGRQFVGTSVAPVPGRATVGLGQVRSAPSSQSIGALPTPISSNLADDFENEVLHTYVARADANKSELELEPYQLVFVARHNEAAVPGVVTVRNLHQMNRLLRDGYYKGQAILKNRSHGDAYLVDDVRDATLAEMPENAIGAFEELLLSGVDLRPARLRQKPAADDAQLESSLSADELAADEQAALLMRILEAHSQTINTPALRYQTKHGILDLWNFLGVIKNTQTNNTTADIDRYMNYPVLNVVVGKKAETTNVFSDGDDMQPGAHVFLILRRKKMPDGTSYGEFEIVPYVERGVVAPPLNVTQYRDNTGRIQDGHVWYVGFVGDVGRDPAVESLRRAAVGNTGNSSVSAQEATARLPTMMLYLKVR